MSKHFSRCGGTGRHKGLKIPRGRLRTGSNPVIGTSWRFALRPQKIRRVFLVCFFTPRYCRAAKVPKTRTVRNKNARRRIWLIRVDSSLFRRKLLTNPVIGYPRRLALRSQKIRRVFLVCFFTPRYCRAAKVPKTRIVLNKGHSKQGGEGSRKPAFE